MRLFEFADTVLYEGYKEVKQRFSLEADSETVQKTMDQFRDLVNRNQVHGDEKNIDSWGKRGWEEFKSFVNKKSQIKTRSQSRRGKTANNSEKIWENDDWTAVVPYDRHTSCQLGRGTSWCTAILDSDHFKNYVHNDEVVLVYFLNKHNDDKWAVAVYPETESDDSYGYDDEDDFAGFDTDVFPDEEFSTTIFNKDDDQVTPQVFRAAVGMDVDRVVQMVNREGVRLRVKSYVNKAVSKEKNIWKRVKSFDFSKRDPGFENEIIDADHETSAAYYIKHVHEQLGAQTYPRELANLAIRKSPSIYTMLAEPTIANMKTLIRKDPLQIALIDNPPDEIVQMAIEAEPRAIRLTKRFSVQHQEYIAQRFPKMLLNLEGVDQPIRSGILNVKPDLFKWIKEPTPKDEYVAVMADENNIQHVKNPGPELLELVPENILAKYGLSQ